MSRPDIIANMERGWNRAPAVEIAGTPRTGVSAALWTHDEDDQQEVCAEPDASCHIVCVPQSNYMGEMFNDDRQVFAKAIHRGTVCIVNSGIRPRAIQRGRWSVLHLYLPKSILNLTAETGMLTSDGHGVELIDPKCVPDRFIELIGLEVLSEMRHGEPLSQLRIDALGQELSIRLLRCHSNLIGTRALARPQTQGGLAPWQVKRVCEAMIAAMDAGDEEASLAELALTVGLSANHFCRGFAQSTGLPPHRWMTERRIERAGQLLLDPGLSLTEIAIILGYTSQSAFGRAFARVTGVAPSVRRRELLS